MDAHRKQILDHWTKFFNCSFEEIMTPGTTFVPKDNLLKSRKIYSWYIENRTFLMIDSMINDEIIFLTKKSGKDYRKHAISLSDLLSFGKEKIKLDYKGFVYILDPQNFIYNHPREEFEIRQLLQKDKDILDTFYSACKPEEVEESFVEIEHQPYVYGAFNKDETIIGAGSAYNFGGFTDLGILVHPDFRKYGIGKSIISTLIKKILQNNELVMYRSQDWNKGSMKLAESLGFEKYCNQESLILL